MPTHPSCCTPIASSAWQASRSECMVGARRVRRVPHLSPISVPLVEYRAPHRPCTLGCLTRQLCRNELDALNTSLGQHDRRGQTCRSTEIRIIGTCSMHERTGRLARVSLGLLISGCTSLSDHQRDCAGPNPHLLWSVFVCEHRSGNWHALRQWFWCQRCLQGDSHAVRQRLARTKTVVLHGAM